VPTSTQDQQVRILRASNENLARLTADHPLRDRDEQLLDTELLMHQLNLHQLDLHQLETGAGSIATHLEPQQGIYDRNTWIPPRGDDIEVSRLIYGDPSSPTQSRSPPHTVLEPDNDPAHRLIHSSSSHRLRTCDSKACEPL
jgi:hypothetical protein